MSTTIDQLQIEITSNSSSASNQIDRLASSLTRLKESSKLTRVVNNLNKLNQALQGLQSTSITTQRITKLGESLKGLSGIKTSGLTSTLNNLKKLPEIVNNLDTANMDKFKRRIIELTEILRPLNTQLSNVAKAFSALPRSMRGVNSSLQTADTNTQKTGKSFGGLFSKVNLSMAGIIAITRKAVQDIGDSVNSMNEYIENVNLFCVSMGSYYEEAKRYAELVQDKLSIDSSGFMRAQGVFMSMANGFGVASDKAYKLSKGLTEISYDISSLYNLPIEESFLKVRSGLAGELEPLRGLGYALSEASLQELAYQKGIQQKVNTMTEAQKAQLRYVAIVEQTARMGAIGDLAKTLESPSNAIRILKQQITQLGRALGSVFIPILQQIIPYVQAFVKVLTNLIKAFAVMVGFKMPDWSNKDWGNGLGGVKDNAQDSATALGDATKKAKELKNATLGFDELNVISPPDPNSGGSGNGNTGIGGDLGLDLPSVWDEGMLASINSQVDQLVAKFNAFGDTLYKMFIEPLGVIDVTPLKDSLINLWEALQPFGMTVGAGLYWFYLNVLIPLAQWTIESILPDFLNGLAAVLDWLTPKLQEFGEWISTHTDTIKDLAIGFGALWLGFKGADIIFDVITAFQELMKGSGFLKTLIDDIKRAFGSGGLSGIFSVLKGLVGMVAGQFSLFLINITPIAGVATVLGSVIYVLWQNFDLVLGVIKTFIEKIDLKGKFDAILESIQPLLESLGGLDDLLSFIGSVIITILTPAIMVLSGLFNSIVSVIKPVIKIITGVIDILGALGSMLVGRFTNDTKKFNESWVKLGNGIVEVFGGLWDGVVGFLTGFVEGVIGFFTSLWDTLVGHSIVPDTINSIVEWFASLPGAILNGLWTFITNVVQYFLDMGTNIWNNLVLAWESIKTWFLEYVAPIFTFEYWQEKFSYIVIGITTKLNEFKNTASKKWTEIKTWFAANVAPKFTLTYWTDKFKNMVQGIKDKLTEFKSVVDEKWNAIKEWFNSNVAPKLTLSYWIDKFINFKDGFVQTIKNMLNAGIDMINKFIDWLNSKMHFSWDAITLAGQTIVPAGSVQLFTIPKITQRFEAGGFIEDGLFTMNDGEIAGKFNNGKSVVANNQQIIEGISEGVYEAVMRAYGEQSGDKPMNINVYLDGKQLSSGIRKADNEKGRSLFGDELGYNY